MVFKRQGSAFIAEHPYYAMVATGMLLLLAMVVAFSRKPTAPKNDPSVAKRIEQDKNVRAAQKKQREERMIASQGLSKSLRNLAGIGAGGFFHSQGQWVALCSAPTALAKPR